MSEPADNVVPFSGITVLDTDPVRFLEVAKTWGLKRALVVGWDADGRFTWGGSFSDLADMNLLLDLAHRRVLDHCETPPA